MENIKLDWNSYIEKSVEAVSEGIVMLKNDNNALPISKDEKIAIFGRIQLNYYKSGTGSGGLVNVSKVVGITEALLDEGAQVNKKLLDTYTEWTTINRYDLGEGWGGEPWSQKEMPLDEGLVKEIADDTSKAIVIIGRTAGEEQDAKKEKGSYLLTDEEERMLSLVRQNFKSVIVLLNVGGIIDMSFVTKYDPDAVMYVWHGGMIGGIGTAKVLLGEVSPSGKLPDTIALNVEDYPAFEYFGDPDRNYYSEDIYVGYRYFETFEPKKVMYPFGFGMSYTQFSFENVSVVDNDDSITFGIKVTNIGNVSGKEVVEVYVKAPQGLLSKPARVLCGFEKTSLLAPGQSEILNIEIKFSDIASFDDLGVTGNRDCFVLEAGEYDFYIGADVRSAEKYATRVIDKLIVTQELSDALAPVVPFERMKAKKTPDGFKVEFENVPATFNPEVRRLEAEKLCNIEYSGDKGIKLLDVYNGEKSLEEFIAQLSDYDLSCIIRGEGMCSPRVTAGTASAFGGVSDSLTALGIPAVCCSDGPSGMRFDSGAKAFSIPIGTLLAATFNKKLLTELFTFMGLEMRANHVDCLLGPGMNIHRYALNGRNFEYFSEDPFLTGKMAAAELVGLTSVGVTGTVKHFCGNNQEFRRHNTDSVISKRALREIYLKGFEMAVKEGGATTIMTTYGSVNGLWTASSYDLTTTILRNEWGFEGVAMTDWWANINRRGCEPDKSDFAAMATAQNDVYMVCADGGNHDDNVMKCLEDKSLSRAQLVRCAYNILDFVLSTHAMKRAAGDNIEVEIINRENEAGEENLRDVPLYKLTGDMEIPLDNLVAVKGRSFAFNLDISKFGIYNIIVTASSNSSELAQIPVTVFRQGSAMGTLTFNGTNGEDVSKSVKVLMLSRYMPIRVYFSQSGLDVKSIRVEFYEDTKAKNYSDYSFLGEGRGV